MSESVRRRKYRYDRVLIETERVLSPQFDDAVVYLTGAQIEMLRNVSQYLNRLDTYVTEYNPGYYIAPTAEDYDDILEIVADLEETLMGNPNTIWGYKDELYFDVGQTKSGDGQWDQWKNGPDAGELWVMQALYLQNTTGARGTVTLRVCSAPGCVPLLVEATPGVLPVCWTGAVIVANGGFVNWIQDSCLNGDVIEAAMFGYTMDVPE